MLDQVLFATYCLGLGAIVNNLIRNKLQNDLEENIRSLREYDLNTDKLVKEQLDDKDVVLLMKCTNEETVMSQ